MARRVYVFAPPASSIAVAAGRRAQVKVPGDRTREAMLDPGDLCEHSGQKPARAERGPSPVPCGRSRCDDEDQGGEVAAAAHDRRCRALGVPDRPVNAGDSRSLADNPVHRLTFGWAGRPAAQTNLPSWVIFRAQGHETHRVEVVTVPTLIDAGKRSMPGTTAARRRRQGRQSRKAPVDSPMRQGMGRALSAGPPWTRVRATFVPYRGDNCGDEQSLKGSPNRL